MGQPGSYFSLLKAKDIQAQMYPEWKKEKLVIITDSLTDRTIQFIEGNKRPALLSKLLVLYRTHTHPGKKRRRFEIHR